MTQKYDEQPSTRERILYMGAKLTSTDRNKMYGDPVINMQNIGDLWSTYLLGKYGGKVVDPLHFALTGEDVAHMCALMKIARTYKNSKHMDNYVDAATYIAIAGQCAEQEETDE